MRVNLKSGELPSSLHVTVADDGCIVIQRVNAGYLCDGDIRMQSEEAEALALMLDAAAFSAKCAAKRRTA